MKKTGILVLLLLSVAARAQFIIGWSGGYALCRELNREIYVYDQINGALTKEMKPVHWYQGLVIGFQSPGDGPFGELTYNRKRAMVSSEWDSSGVEMTRQLKVLCNTFNLGFGYRNSGWTIGISCDLGRFKGKGRRGVKSSIGDQEFERLWVLDRTRLLGIAVYRLFAQETIFVERNFGFINFRLYAQLPGMSSQLDGLDTWMFGQDLNFGMHQHERFFNLGAQVTFSIGK